MSDICIGTSGYDYIDWKNILYPPTTKRQDYLSIYSTVFNTLELNFSYYRMPKASMIESIVKRSEFSLDFSIKANKTLTHTIDPVAWKENVNDYRKGIEPLLTNNRLVSILFEFPYSFHYAPDNRIYLDKLLTEFKDIPSVVEFRNKEWYTPRVFDGLLKRNVNLCLLDMPTSILDQQAIDIPIFDLTYLRFHGRNDDNWWKGDNVSRYDYLYSKEELSTWAHRLNEIKGKTKRVRIYFNNHAKGNAVKNALMMKELMKLD